MKYILDNSLNSTESLGVVDEDYILQDEIKEFLMKAAQWSQSNKCGGGHSQVFDVSLLCDVEPSTHICSSCEE